jgi:hypothetical protein
MPPQLALPETSAPSEKPASKFSEYTSCSIVTVEAAAIPVRTRTKSVAVVAVSVFIFILLFLKLPNPSVSADVPATLAGWSQVRFNVWLTACGNLWAKCVPTDRPKTDMDHEQDR